MLKRAPMLRDRSFGLLSLIFVIALLVFGFLIGSLINRVSQPPAAPAAEVENSRPEAGAMVSPPYLVQDFTLTSQTGEPIRLSDLRGRAVLMFFGYTHCPDVCPTTLADYRRVKQALGNEAKDAAFVFISIDGERDTPDVLSQYLGQFDADFIGMTGDEETLRKLGAQFGLIFEQQTDSQEHEHEGEDTHTEDLTVDNYFVDHTSPSFLIDPDGYLRTVYFYNTKVDAVVEGIRGLVG